MGNIALGKKILETENWIRFEELTNNNFRKYDGKRGYSYAKWPGNLTLDLGKVEEIETIRFLLYDEDERIYKYRLLTSSDLNEWTVHYDSAEHDCKGWQEFNFQEKISARYIRIHCLWNSKNRHFHIIELQVYDKDTEDLNLIISNKKLLSTKSTDQAYEFGDGSPFTIQVNELISGLEKIIQEYSYIKPEPIQEIILNLRTQAHDVETLEKSLGSIRREILNPVKKELEAGRRIGKYSIWGFIVGFLGIVISIFAILNGIFKWI